MKFDAPTNMGKLVLSNIAKPTIHKWFSLVVGPNDVVWYYVTWFPAFYLTKCPFRWSDKQQLILHYFQLYNIFSVTQFRIQTNTLITRITVLLISCLVPLLCLIFRCSFFKVFSVIWTNKSINKWSYLAIKKTIDLVS